MYSFCPSIVAENFAVLHGLLPCTDSVTVGHHRNRSVLMAGDVMMWMHGGVSLASAEDFRSTCLAEDGCSCL